MKKKILNQSTLQWLWRVPGKKKGYIATLSLLQVLTGSCGVFEALLLKRIVDNVVSRDSAGFRESALWMVMLIGTYILLQFFVRWQNEKARSTFENLLKKRQMDNLLRKDYASVSGIHSGEWMNRMTNDTVVVTTGYVEILPGILGTVIKIGTSLGMLAVLDTEFALTLIPVGLLLMGITVLFRRKLKALHREMQEKDGEVRIYLQERIESLMMIKSFSAEERTSQEAETKMGEHQKARMRRTAYANFANTGLNTALDGIYLFGVFYCANGILTGKISYGTLTAVMQLMTQIRSPLVNITSYLPKYYAMLSSAERLMAVEAFPEDCEEKILSAAEAEELYRQISSLGLYGADYAYYPPAMETESGEKAQMPVVLRDVTVEIQKGEYVAFTGHSGCGKSTVLKLMMSMYALDGGERSIRMVDGKVIPLSAKQRRLFAYVPQGNQLMTGSIREIVSFAGEGKEDERRMEESLRLACADQFVAELKDGKDTMLGERGTGLSEGQMQRIAIARALYSGAPILLLDEATSALDAATEEKLLSNLKTLTNRTVIIVTHRPAALEICDRVLEFSEDGIRTVEPARQEV